MAQPALQFKLIGVGGFGEVDAEGVPQHVRVERRESARVVFPKFGVIPPSDLTEDVVHRAHSQASLTFLLGGCFREAHTRGPQEEGCGSWKRGGIARPLPFQVIRQCRARLH
jgi:hypothetical protein